MALLIDGHNLIGQLPDLSLADPDDEEQLVARLAAYQRRHRTSITVVFDPGPHGGGPGAYERRTPGIRVLYAPPGLRADDIICRLVRQARDRKGIVVVSSDRAVQDEARYLGAAVLSAQEFARQMAPPAIPPPPDRKELPVSDSEVQEWLRVFQRRRQAHRR